MGIQMLRWLCAAVPLTMIAAPAQAGFMATTNISVSQSHSTFTPRDESYYNQAGDGSNGLVGGVSDGYSFSLASASASASGGLTGPNNTLELHTYATGSANGNLPFEPVEKAGAFIATALATWTDYVTVLSGDAQLTSLFIEINVDGTFNTIGNALASAQASVESNGGIRRDTPGSLVWEIPLWNNTGMFHIALSSGVMGNAGGPDNYYSAATSDFSHTLTITSMLVRDSNGNLVTPESLGYSLQFESGMSSPNDSAVSATPAPPGIVLAGTGAFLMLGRAWLRRRTRPVVA